jgi:membrane associated rhomboid family serine protease
MAGFGRDTIAALANRVASQAPVAVRAAFGGSRASMAVHLAMDADTLMLAGPPKGRERGLDVRVARTQITGARRLAPNRIELGVRVPGDRLASSLRAIECDNVDVIERIVAWLPEAAYRSDLIRQWYDQALGRYRRDAWATHAIAFVTALAFLAQTVAAGALDLSPQVLIAQGGNFAPATLGGEPWRLLMAVFLHGDPDHFVGNLVALLVLAPFAERVFGRAGFLAIYLGTGLIASAVDLWTNFLVVSVGASGAIFGVLGALIAYAVRRRGHLPMRAIRIITIAGSVFAAWSFWQGFQSEGINNSAHLSGFASGLAIGAWIAPPLIEPSARRRVLVLASAGFAAIVAAIGMNQALVRALSSDWPVVRLLDDLAGRADGIDANCQSAVDRVTDGSDTSIDPFVAACITPLETIEQDLARLEPSDPILREELDRRLTVLRDQLAKNREAAASVTTMQALAPAEERRVAAVETCHAALREVDAGRADDGLQTLVDQCVPGLGLALDLLPRQPAGNPEMLRYVFAARALWQAEHAGFQRMAEAIRGGDATGFEDAAASVRAAREAFEAATGHSGTDDAGDRAMRARKTSVGRAPLTGG